MLGVGVGFAGGGEGGQVAVNSWLGRRWVLLRWSRGFDGGVPALGEQVDAQ